MDEMRLSVLDQIEQLEELVLEGNRIPFSGGRLINDQEALIVLDAISESIPSDLLKAREIIQQRNEFIQHAKRQAAEIVQQATQKRNQLVSPISVREEAARQVKDLISDTKLKCDQQYEITYQTTMRMERDMQIKISKLEQHYANLKNKWEKESLENRKNLELESNKLKLRLAKQHQHDYESSKLQLEHSKNESIKIIKHSKSEAERIHNNSVKIMEQTQHKCHELLLSTNEEANAVRNRAKLYADKTLKDLEAKLNSAIKSTILRRQELDRSKTTAYTLNNKDNHPNTISMNNFKRRYQVQESKSSGTH